MNPVPVAFYAPMKPPDHAQPSGDRTMARLLLRALGSAGYAPEIASRIRTWEAGGDEVRQRAIRAASLEEAERLAAGYARSPAQARPRLWFTYHCYYKAPDHLGPEIARRLGIPYVIAEASRAPKRAGGPYAFANAAAEDAIAAADTLFVMTGQDRECLERALRPGQRLIALPPFVDAAPLAVSSRRSSGSVRLLAVGMMRPGDKLSSYRILAEALARIPDLPWFLDVAGDGMARPEVERLFAGFGSRVTLLGARDEASLASLYAHADLLVWPAVNEAYGMALLEAQAQGCPVVAGRCGGVPDVVLDGVTGRLAPPGETGAFAEAVAALVGDPVRRAEMGEAALRFVRRERSLAGAAAILREALGPLVALPGAA
ncbi:glycosyltransferase family 4 protein [Enterovirga aerilata]|uniref:Glycosyltransferase family 4 protein n=1 Tax=Enterovirga aerilata TaxID=2730920 RepID=A0A849I5Z5_9HYPH|nr:glycosyltransferase family 4 protein [Enterovirga sp. DB1703]NNM74892.1 glycosyltransferase family 4 protein [Enterovirga sp. DB1703]